MLYQLSEASAHCSGRDMWMTLVQLSTQRRSRNFTNIRTPLIHQYSLPRRYSMRTNFRSWTYTRQRRMMGLFQHHSTTRRPTQINTSISFLTTQLPINKLSAVVHKGIQTVLFSFVQVKRRETFCQSSLGEWIPFLVDLKTPCTRKTNTGQFCETIYKCNLTLHPRSVQSHQKSAWRTFFSDSFQLSL